jgi:hypothetical protein
MCGPAPGWAAQTGDCDDTDADARPDARWWWDGDRDGYGDPARQWPIEGCERPQGTAGNGEDCDDVDPGQHPGVTWYLDTDGDGIGGDWSGEDCHDERPATRRRGDCDDTDAAETAALALEDVPGTLNFTWCWASCGEGSWAVAPDGAFSATGFSGSWSYDCPTGTLTVTYASGTVYTGVTHDGTNFAGTMRSYTGTEGTWTGTLGPTDPG